MTQGRQEESLQWAPYALGAILVAAVAVRLWLFVGIARPDMFRYMELSHHVLVGGSLFSESAFYASSRLTLIVPLITSNWLFGYGQHVSVAWPFLCSIGTVALGYFLARRLWDEKAGLIAAVGLALAPIEVEHGTQLLPDPIETFFVVLAIYLAVVAVQRDDDWRRWAIASGAALGLAYFTRVNALVFLPLVLLAGVALEPARWKRSLWSLAGLAAVLAGAAIVFWVLSGDPLVDWHRSLGFYSRYASQGPFARDTTFRYLITTQPTLRWIPMVLALSAIFVALRRTRRNFFVLAWAVGFYVYLDFVGPLHGLVPSYRYAEPLAVPVILLGAAAVSEAMKVLPQRTRFVPVAVVVVLLAIGLVPVRRVVNLLHRNPRWTSAAAAAKQLARIPKRPTYVDDEWVLLPLNYYSGFAFDRDTLLLPGAPVNRRARLFRTNEVRWPPTAEESYLLSTRPPPIGYEITRLASFEHASRKQLVLYRMRRR